MSLVELKDFLEATSPIDGSEVFNVQFNARGYISFESNYKIQEDIKGEPREFNMQYRVTVTPKLVTKCQLINMTAALWYIVRKKNKSIRDNLSKEYDTWTNIYKKELMHFLAENKRLKRAS